MRRKPFATALLYGAVALFVVVTLAPVAWLFILSVSRPADLTAKPLRFLPAQFDWSAYRRLFDIGSNTAGEAFLFALRNSLGASLGASAVAVAVSIPAAWAFARYRRRAVRATLHGVLATTMLPAVALVLPLYFLLATLHLLNSVSGLVLVYCAVLTPFTAWFITQSFAAVPDEIEQAAAMDGATLAQTLLHVTLPLARAGLATAALFALLLAWDEFFFALLFTSNANAKTLTVTIADFAAGRATDFGLVAAAGLLTSLPPVAIAFVLQKALIGGLAAGGVKG